MDTGITTIIQTSIGVLCFYYFNKTENKQLKVSIALLGLSMLGLILAKAIHLSVLIKISLVLIYPGSMIFFLNHIHKKTSIKNTHKMMIQWVLALVFVSLFIKIIGFPGYGIIRLLSITSLGCIVYLNFTRSKELEEELRFLDLIAVQIVIELALMLFAYLNR